MHDTKWNILRMIVSFLAMLLQLSCGGATDQNSAGLITNQNDLDVYGAAALREKALVKGLFYGAATFKNRIVTDPLFAAAFAKECNILVPEGELKWAAIRPSPTTFDFSATDMLLTYCQEHKMLFRGHTLIWHQALPSWFADYVTLENAEQMLREHIITVVTHYRGKVHSWDVVNEAIEIGDRDPEGYRTSSPWFKLLGPRYIDIAFRAAAEADSSAMLVYNECGLEYDTPDGAARRTAVLALLKKLKGTGVPIQALGIQSHLSAEETHFTPEKLKTFLRDVASLGLKIIITELDVSEPTIPGDTALRDKIIAGVYRDYLAVVLQETAVIGVLTWGLSDKYTWINAYAPRKDGALSRPLPIDDQFQRKLTWNALASAIELAPSR